MSQAISIEIDTDEINEKVKCLKKIPGGTTKAVTRSLNKTLTGMRTDTKNLVAEDYHIEKADVYKNLNVSDRANYSKLNVSLRSNARPVRLMKFNTTVPNENPGRKGAKTVFGNTKRSNSGDNIKGAFIATMHASNGVTGVFARTGVWKKKWKKVKTGKFKIVKYKRVKTEQIEQKHGPGIVQMLNNERIREEIQLKATNRFNKALDQQIKYLLENS